MKSRTLQSGFTLIELMVGLVITLIFLSASAMSVMTWNYNRAILQAKGDLTAVYGMAKAMAVRNPTGATDAANSAGIRLVLASGTTDHILYVCAGDPLDSVNCTSGGNALLTSRTIPAAVTISLTVGTGACTGTGLSKWALGLDNTGQPTDGKGAVSPYDYSLSLGSAVLGNVVSDCGTLR